MLAHQEEPKTTETPTPGGEPVSFVEQMRRIKETQSQRVIFKIDDEDEEEKAKEPIEETVQVK